LGGVQLQARETIITQGNCKKYPLLVVVERTSLLQEGGKKSFVATAAEKKDSPIIVFEIIEISK